MLYVAVLVLMAYGLFFLYDVFLVKRPQFGKGRVFFYAGCFLVIAASFLLALDQIAVFPRDLVSLVCLGGAGVSFALMLKALFFSLPAGTYSRPTQGRSTYRAGMYALCRHPGVLWYCLFFLFMALAFRSVAAFVSCALLCAGNVAYMLFQDAWSFPRIFCDYADYRRCVPFFIPTANSIRAACSSLPTKGEKA